MAVEHPFALLHLLAQHPTAGTYLGLVQVLADTVVNAIVFAVDDRRRVTLWNKGAERLLGRSRSDVIGRPCAEAVRRPECVVACHLCERACEPSVTTVVYRGAGEAVTAMRYAYRFEGDDGAFVGGLEVLVPLPDVGAPVGPGVEAFHELRTVEPAVSRLFALVRKVARTDSPVLLVGEPGSSRARLARALHAESGRASGAIVEIDGNELTWHARRPAELVAVQETAARALGGTLYLHDVDQLDLPAQAWLARLLASWSGRPDAPRLVASSRTTLGAEVRAGRFRADLALRLEVVAANVPPLRDRPADIPVLAARRLAELEATGPRRVDGFSPEALDLLRRNSWPGNVGELENAVTHAYVVGEGPLVGAEDLPPSVLDAVPPTPSPEDDAVIAERVEGALRATDGHVGRAAEALGVSRSTFWRWRKRTLV